MNTGNARMDQREVKKRLLPTLRAAVIERIQQDHFGKGLVEDCRNFRLSVSPLEAAHEGSRPFENDSPGKNKGF